MMRISIVYLGSTGAGPAYAFEMAKALSCRTECKLQLIISNRVLNKEVWTTEFKNDKSTELVFVDTYKRNNLHALLSIFNLYRQEKVVKLVKKFKADCAYFPFGSIWGNYLFWRLKRYARVINTLHDPDPHYPPRNNTERIMYFANIANRHVSDIILLNNKDVPKVIERYHKKVLVIPHASFSYYSRDNKITNEFKLQKTIGFIGRIEPYKGLDILIDAFSKIASNGIRLIVAGSGIIDGELLKRITSNKNIELINRYIEDDEIPHLLNRMDYLVLPYRNATQSGVIPLAFSMSKTVIATNVGALDEQVPEGTGFLVNVSSEKVAEKIDYLYKNPDLIKEMGVNAHQFATTKLTWEHSAELLIEHLL